MLPRSPSFSSSSSSSLSSSASSLPHTLDDDWEIVDRDPQLSATQEAADHVDALVALKTQMSTRRRFGSGRCLEQQVARALEASYPELLSQLLWPENADRPDAAARWLSRIASCAKAGLLSAGQAVELMLSADKRQPLAQKALSLGDPRGQVFAAIVTGHVQAARDGVIRGRDLMTLLQSCSHGRTLLGMAAELDQPTDIQSLLDAALAARCAEALTQQEYRRVVTQAGQAHDVLSTLCERRKEASALGEYLGALLRAEQSGKVQAGLLASVLLTRDARGAFVLETAGKAKAAVIEDILVVAGADGLISAPAQARIRGVIRH